MKKDILKITKNKNDVYCEVNGNLVDIAASYIAMTQRIIELCLENDKAELISTLMGMALVLAEENNVDMLKVKKHYEIQKEINKIEEKEIKKDE